MLNTLPAEARAASSATWFDLMSDIRVDMSASSSSDILLFTSSLYSEKSSLAAFSLEILPPMSETAAETWSKELSRLVTDDRMPSLSFAARAV